MTKVKFSIALGFDDKMWSKELLDVPKGMSLRFLYLYPPDEITYFDYTYKTRDVDKTYSKDADTSGADVGMMYSGVPVVKLDSWLNPYDTTVAMIWPADNATANVFKKTSPTDDGGVVKYSGISLMRWVKPEFMRIIEFPLTPILSHEDSFCVT